MSYNIGSLALDLNVDISSAQSSALRVSNIYRQMMTSAAKAPLDALRTGMKEVSKGFSSGLSGAMTAGTNSLQGGMMGAAGGFAGALKGSMAGIAKGFGDSILNTAGQLLTTAAELKFSVGQSIIGGYANAIMEGVSNYGEETRSTDLAELVLQIAEGNKEGMDRMETYTSRLDKIGKLITETATELSYDRVTIAKLVEGLAKTGVSEKELLGGNTAASRAGSLANQTAMLAEAMNLGAEQIDEAVKLMTLGRAAYGELSNETIANTMLGIYANTAQEPERIKYGLQDALPAAKAAGVGLTDASQLVTQLAKLSSFEVAGTLAKTLLQSLATPERLDKNLDNVISPYYVDEERGTDGEGKRNSFIGDATKEGGLVESIKELYENFNRAYKDGRMGSLGGNENQEQAGKYYQSLDESMQNQLIEQAMAKYFGGGDTTVQTVRALMASKPEDDGRLKESLQNFYGGKLETLDDQSPLEAFKKVKQEGFSGALDLVGSSIDNVKKAMGEELSPALVTLVTLFKDVANNLTDSSNKWLGGLERVNNALMDAFSNEDLATAMTAGMEALIISLGSQFERHSQSLITFLEEPENVENAFDGAINAVKDMVSMFVTLTNTMQAMMPVVDMLTGLIAKITGTDIETPAEKEAKQNAKEEIRYKSTSNDYKPAYVDQQNGEGQLTAKNLAKGNKYLRSLNDFDSVKGELTKEEREQFKQDIINNDRLDIQTGGLKRVKQTKKNPSGTANDYVKNYKSGSREKEEAANKALDKLIPFTLKMNGEMVRLYRSATGIEGGNNLYRRDKKGQLEAVSVKGKEGVKFRDEINAAIMEQNKKSPNKSNIPLPSKTSDNTVKGYGRFATTEDVAKIDKMYQTFVKNEDGSFKKDKDGKKVREMSYEDAVQNMVKASNSEITKVFGEGNANFDLDKDEINVKKTDRLSTENLAKDKNAFNNLLKALNQDNDLSKFLKAESKTGGKLENTGVNTVSTLVDGKVKDEINDKKVSITLTKDQTRDIAGRAGSGEEGAQAAAQEAIQVSQKSMDERMARIIAESKKDAKEAGNTNITGGLTRRFKEFFEQSDNGELVGDTRGTVEAYIQKNKMDIQNTDLSDKERAEKQKINESLAKAFSLTKDTNYTEGQNSGIAEEMKVVQQLLSGLITEQLKAENEIVELRQKGLELQKDTMIQTAAVMGQVNSGLSEVLGIFNELDGAGIQKEAQLAMMDDDLRRDLEDSETKYGGKLSGYSEDYKNSSVYVPYTNFSSDIEKITKGDKELSKGEEFINKQKSLIDLDAMKRKEINDNFKKQQDSFVAKLNNVAERMYESIREGMMNLVESYSTQGGEGASFANQSTKLYDSTETSLISLSQSLQTLKTLDKSAPGSVKGEDIKMIEQSMALIPEYFKQTMSEVYSAFVQKLDDYTSGLIDREKTRQVNNLQNTGAGTESYKMLMNLQNVELANTRQIRENEKADLQLNNEINGLKRQLQNIQIAQAISPDRVGLKARGTMTESAIRVTTAQKDINTLKVDADSLQADKDRLNVITDAAQALVRDIQNTKNAFGTITSEAVAFENTLSTVKKRTDEWSKVAMDVKNAYNKDFSQTGAMNFEGFDEYIDAMKKMSEEIQDIALVKVLQSITRKLEDYRIEIAGLRASGREGDRDNEVSLIRSETSGESYRADIQMAQIQAQGINEEADRALMENSRTAAREMENNKLRERELKAEYAAEPTDNEEAKLTRQKEAEALMEERRKIEEVETEKARQINNNRKTQLELLKDEATMTGRISKEIGNIVASGFDDLFDTLTDRTDTWGNKFKELGDNLMKQLGKVGWEMLFGGIKDKIVSSLTKKSREKQEQERVSAVQSISVDDITSGGFDINKLTNQEAIQKMMQQSTGFSEKADAINRTVQGDLAFDENYVAEETKSVFDNLMASDNFAAQDFSASAADNADLGVKGIARNTAYILKMFETQLTKQDALITAVQAMGTEAKTIPQIVEEGANKNYSYEGVAESVNNGTYVQPTQKVTADENGNMHYYYDGRYHATPKEGAKSEFVKTQIPKSEEIVKPAEVTPVTSQPLKTIVEKAVTPAPEIKEDKKPRRQIGLNKGDIIDLGDTEAGKKYNNVRGNIPEALIVNEMTTGKQKPTEYYGTAPKNETKLGVPEAQINLGVNAPASTKTNIDYLMEQQEVNKKNKQASVQNNVNFLANQPEFNKKGVEVASTNLAGLGIDSKRIETKPLVDSMDKNTKQVNLLTDALLVENKLSTQLDGTEIKPEVISKGENLVKGLGDLTDSQSTTNETPSEVAKKEGKITAKDGLGLAQQIGIIKPPKVVEKDKAGQITDTISGALASSGNPYAAAAGAILPMIYGLFKGKEKPKRYNTGVSTVPGSGNTDSVPALLTPGEAVLTKGAVERLGGREFIEAANFGRSGFLHKYTGGMIDRGHALLLNKGGMVKPTSLGMKKFEKAPRASQSAIEGAKYNQMTDNQKSIENFNNQNGDASMTGRKLQDENTLKIEYSSKVIAGTSYVTEETFQRGLEATVGRAQQNMMKSMRGSTRTRKQLGL
jgi:hypothetical protein